MTDAPSSPSFGNPSDSVGSTNPAASVADQARQAGAAVADHARDVADEARNRAASLADTLKEQATSLGEAQKDKAADTLESVAKAIHKTGAELEGQQDWAAHLVEKGAAELNTLASALRRNDMQGLMSNLGDLARRQPAVFVGASMTAGFLLTRIGRLAADGATTASTAPAPHSPSTPAPSSPPAAEPAPNASTFPPETNNGQF